MSSHCFMKTDKHLVAQEVEQDLKEVIHRKFKNLLTIECRIVEDEICDWDVRFDDTHGFPICLKTNGKLDFVYPDDAWSRWAQSIVEYELGRKYNCSIKDEEYPCRDFIPTCHSFENYLENSMHHSKEWKKAIIAIELSHLPPELKKL